MFTVNTSATPVRKASKEMLFDHGKEPANLKKEYENLPDKQREQIQFIDDIYNKLVVKKGKDQPNEGRHMTKKTSNKENLQPLSL